MRNDENACIRYLMKEMDPSEEVLMERAMMEDEDLLIEVESMRRTLGRLEDLPDKEPSCELTDSIVEEAAEYRKGVLSSRFVTTPLVRFAAAAVVLLAVSAGGFYAYDFLSAGGADGSRTTSQAALGGTASPSDAGQGARVTPWVDRNNVLRLEQTAGSGSDRQALDSIFRSATRKLTPLNDSFFYGNRNPSYQLTGSGSN